ncbi:MAG: S8 family serine peptidase, partial [Caldilineaceae bacterium]|nr:S8 family serine peptidase [Caldilineaceae bacterium]
MTLRRLFHLPLLCILLIGAFGATLYSSHASAATATTQSNGGPDCVALSAEGQQTLLDAMTALLGDDPASGQFSDTTAFIPNEVLVGSTAADIAQVQNRAGTLGITINAVGDPLTLGAVTVQRFVLDGDPNNHATSVRRLICEVGKLRDSGDLNPTGFAEPNYRISASQWWAAGSRWRDDNLSQYMLEHTGDLLTDFDAYANQWTWGTNGIKLRINDSRTISQTGAGSRVVLFDSSPFAASGNFTMTANVGGINRDLFALQTTERLPQSSFAGSAFPDHGPYVAGLVNVVAPDADLELVRVLGNDDGRGTLADLLAALQEFYDRNGDDASLDLHNTVINLSVGVHHPLPATFASLPVTATFGLPTEVLSLKAFLRYGYDHGAVLVAGAGNDFAFGQADSPWSETPAAYDFVISVGGSNSQGTRSCFSNNGDLFAPAGEGEPGCSGPPAQRCATTPTDCIVSVIHDDQGATNAAFGFWVGSSFAAPQVSGVAALVHEALSDALHVSALTTIPPAKITAVLHCGASTGKATSAVNIIDVAKALSPDCLTLGQTNPGQIRFAQATATVIEGAVAITLTVERINGADGAVRI